MKVSNARKFLPAKHIVLYGILMAVLIFVLKWLQWKFLIVDNAADIYSGLIAVFFTGLGIWIAMQLTRRKVETVIVEKKIIVEAPATDTINQEELDRLALTPREYEVLQLLVRGHSNAEIAQQLFLSLSTVKTHVSNLFFKMEVKSRTQTIEKARRLRIVQ